MPASRGSVPLDQLREAVAGGVEARSLRQVARDVGMSPTGLRKFLDGATPYAATRRKLERWFVREASRYADGPGAGSALAALHVLTRELPSEERRRVGTAIVDLLETAYRARRRAVPHWIRELRDELEAGGASGLVDRSGEARDR